MIAVILSKHKPCTNWTQQDLDMALIHGDKLYQSIHSVHDYLEVEDIPLQITLFEKQWAVIAMTEQHVLVETAFIQQAIQDLFIHTDNILILIGDALGSAACCATKCGDKFVIFDPHSRSFDEGLPTPNGTSVAIFFSSIQALVQYLTRLGTELKSQQISMWAFDCSLKMKTVFQCSICKKTFKDESNLKQHLVHDHSNIFYLCNLCQKTVKGKQNFAQHNVACRKHHAAQNTVFECHICGQNFNNAVNKESHVKRCLRKRKLNPLETEDCSPAKQNTHFHYDEKEQLQGDNPPKSYVCVFCQKILQNQVNLARHQEKCGNKQKLSVTNFFCANCKRKFGNAFNLKEHEKKCIRPELAEEKHWPKKASDKIYQCAYCSRTFGNAFNLKEHERKCSQSQCMKETGDNETPMAGSKNNDKSKAFMQQYVCSKCGQILKSAFNQTRHEAICTGEQTHVCSKCGKKFARTAFWKRHEARCQVNTACHGSDAQYKAAKAEKQRERRLDPAYKATEAQKKREQRSDPGFKATEAKKKCEKRSNPEYKAIEAQQMREKRSDPEFKANEAQQKREKRSDPEYKANEAQQKREKRLSPEHQLKEFQRRQVHQFGASLEESIAIFLEDTKDGPIYVCTSCLQTMFKDDVQDVTRLRPGHHKLMLDKCITGKISIDGKEWLCNSCRVEIYHDHIPKLSKANLVGFPERPDELKLFPLEETLIAPLLPFMTLRSLPVCGLVAEGQKLIVGNVVHVPNDISSTVDVLPRNLDDMGTIGLELKRKKCYKTAVFKENIRPRKVFMALQFLMEHSDLYKELHLKMSSQNWEDWLNAPENQNTSNRLFIEGCEPNPEVQDPQATDKDKDIDLNEDDFEEIHVSEKAQGNLDTLLDEHQPLRIYQELGATVVENPREDLDIAEVAQQMLTVAPGEGQIPVFRDADAEYKCFPTLFCGGKRPTNDERPRKVHTSEVFKAELRHSDPRVCLNIPNTFWKAKHLQIVQVVSKVTLALRRVVGAKSKKVTAGDLLDEVKRENIEKMNEGYRIFKTVRNSPPYFEQKKKELLGMCRQIGFPTLFFSLSSADTQWPQLIQCLGQLVDGVQYSTDYITTEMTIEKKCQLVAAHPAACSRYFHHRVQKFLLLIIRGPHSPFGKVTDFFYRVEFQKRGSPHIHGFLWVDGAPNCRTATDEEICAYVDKCISCNSNVLPEEEKYIRMQTHKHSRSCKRTVNDKAVCRFGAPWPPMRSTQILEPLDDEEEILQALKKKHAQLIKTMKKMPPDVETFDDWLKFLEIDEGEYIKILRSSLTGKKIFYHRKPSDTRVNPYMKGLLAAWCANHDVQFVLDPYQCVSYICDYMTKSQKGMSELIQMATEEARAGNFDLRHTTRHIANHFLNAAESPIQQCCYDTLRLPMTNSTRRKDFINSNPPEKRPGLCKSMEMLKEMKPESKQVTMLSNIDRYAMRPKQLENWCLANYVARLEVDYKKSKIKYNDEFEEDLIPDPEVQEVHEQEEAFIENDIFPLPTKSGHVLKLRKRNKIIRFRRYNPKKNPEDFFRERLLLYLPWRQENNLIEPYASYEAAFNVHKDIIMKNMNIFEPYASEIDTAYQEFINVQQQRQDFSLDQQDDEDLDEAAAKNDPNLPVLAPEDDSPAFQLDIGVDLGIRPTNAQQDEIQYKPQMLTDEEYYNLLGKLNTKQQEFHTHIMQQAFEDKQVMCVLHGGAGTGKSTVIQALSEGLHRFLTSQPGQNPSLNKLLLVAPTGKAAYNIKGQTIHRAFMIPANQNLEFKPLGFDSLNTARAKFHAINWVLLDEFSMVGKRLLLFIYKRLQEIRGNQLPFGGMNMILFGDLHQLQPVKDGWIFEDTDPHYGALAPNIFKDNFVVFELNEIMRQKDDKRFAEALNRLRTASQTTSDIAMLDSRRIQSGTSVVRADIPRFYTTNANKDAFNELIMLQSAGKMQEIQAQDTPQTNIPKSEQKKALAAARIKPISAAGNLAYNLAIKEGLRYDLTANIDAEDGLVNGAECIVKRIEKSFPDGMPACIWVEFTDSDTGKKARRIRGPLQMYADKGWTPIRAIDRTFVASRNNIVVSRRQFPLVMSAARTIHKAQSATHQEIVVDMSGPAKAPASFWEHMHYVAFSRCTSLQGLHIIDINQPKIRASAKVSHFLAQEKKPLELCYKPLYESDQDFSIVFNNVCSLPKKWSAICNNKNIIGSSIIILAETWLSEKYNEACFDLAGYQKMRLDSKQTKGHRGLLLYYKDSICVDRVCQMDTPKVELVRIEFHYQHRVIHIVGVYKVPGTSQDNLIQELKTFLTTVKFEDDMLCIIGDFNINMNEKDGVHFAEKMKQTFSVNQIVDGPTTWQGTHIDLFFSNVSSVKASALLNTWSAHHYLVGAIKLSR